MKNRKRVYIAFDFDDLGVKQGLIAESRRPDCPFEFVDNSISTAIEGAWAAEAEKLIVGSSCVVVLCGVQTHQARGVATEIQIAQNLRKPYFLLRGTRLGKPTRPKHARAEDRIWAYRWPTLDALLHGRTPPADAAWE